LPAGDKNHIVALVNAAKAIYETKSWDALVNPKTGSLKARVTTGEKCFGFTENMVFGTMCGVCQAGSFKRFVPLKKTVAGAVKMTWTVRFTQSEAVKFATDCQDYFTNQFKVFDMLNHVAILYSFSPEGTSLIEKPPQITAKTLGTHYEPAILKKNFDSCKVAGTNTEACKEIATKYMRFGIATDIDIAAEAKLLEISELVKKKYDWAVKMDNSVIQKLAPRKELKFYKKLNEPVLDFIGLQYADQAKTANPFIDAAVVDVNVAGAKSELGDNQFQISSRMTEPIQWTAQKKCPMANFFNAEGGYTMA
jgi:hypothetical protein